MLTIQALRDLGAQTDEGLARCMGKEDFYFRLIRMGMQDEGYDRLAQAIGGKDYDTAFEAAHALKGVAGNLSLSPLYEALSEITERLRAREEADYPALLQEVLTKRQAFAALCED